jgi:hypothetical protein
VGFEAIDDQFRRDRDSERYAAALIGHFIWRGNRVEETFSTDDATGLAFGADRQAGISDGAISSASGVVAVGVALIARTISFMIAGNGMGMILVTLESLIPERLKTEDRTALLARRTGMRDASKEHH